MAHLLGVDLRGLAFLRIGLALCVLVDLATRAGDLYAHYTDYGVLSRADVLRAFAWLHEWPLSLHMASGSVGVLAAIFLLHAAAATALLLGYRTRLATILTWFLISSLQLRNLLIGGGYDAVLRMLLFWSCFLPLGAYFSLDNLRRGTAAAKPRMTLSAGTIALLAQLVIVYWAAGYAKASQQIWIDGTALLPILHDDFFATGFGRWLGGYPELCSVLARAIVLTELGGPLLLLCSGWSAVLRTLVVATLCVMNLGFLLALDVGLFPWVMSVGVIAFLPSSFWNRASASTFFRRLQAKVSRSATWEKLVRLASAEQQPSPRPEDRSEPTSLISRRGGWLASEFFCILLLVVVIHWNLGVARDRAYSAPAYTNWIIAPLFLQQDWRMFADPAQRTGWVVMPARLVGGREIDLMAAGGRLPRLEEISAYAAIDWTRPRSTLGHYANIRWRVFLRHVLAADSDPPAALLYGRYLCRQWNQRYGGDDQLQTFQVVYLTASLRAPYDALSYNPEVAWNHDCFQ